MAAPSFGLFAFGPQAEGQGDTVSFDYFTLDGQDPSACECDAARRRVRRRRARQDAVERDRPRGSDEVRGRGRRAEGHDRRAATSTSRRRGRRRATSSCRRPTTPAPTRSSRRSCPARSTAATRRAACWSTRTTTTTSSSTRSPTSATRGSTGSSCARRTAARSSEPQPQVDVPRHDGHLAAPDEDGRRRTRASTRSTARPGRRRATVTNTHGDAAVRPLHPRRATTPATPSPSTTSRSTARPAAGAAAGEHAPVIER